LLNNQSISMGLKIDNGTFTETCVRTCDGSLMNTMSTQPSAWTAIARLPRVAGRGLIIVYRYTLSPLIGPRCRHLPSCSEYAEEAIERFGLWAGAWMALARFLRCHPWGTSGLDFVPASLPARARWWMPWRYGRWHGTNEAPPQ
jgi:putative membrane protein insertion efficiency factor